jgi:hypothetical protein
VGELPNEAALTDAGLATE